MISRRGDNLPTGIKCVLSERSQGLRSVSADAFDAVFDFLAYDSFDVSEALGCIAKVPYFLISSTWVTRLGHSRDADQLIDRPADEKMKNLLPVTRKYLLGKNEAERAVDVQQSKGRKAIILRLPIFWGSHDHTGRVAFYANRIQDGNPIILVNGGTNLAQIAWVEDLSSAIVESLQSMLENDRVMWECLPHAGIAVRQVVRDISAGLGKEPCMIDAPEQILRQRLPAYLDIEPLWRESALNITGSNLFLFSGVKPTPQSEWLAQCAREQKDFEIGAIRGHEMNLVKELV